MAVHSGLTALAPERVDLVAIDQARLDELGELVVRLIAEWVEQAREYRRVRQAAGLSSINLAWENSHIKQCTGILGRPGADIALAMLSLSWPTVTAPPVAARSRRTGG